MYTNMENFKIFFGFKEFIGKYPQILRNFDCSIVNFSFFLLEFFFPKFRYHKIERNKEKTNTQTTLVTINAHLHRPK
jgi:hypothetical protein